MKTGRRSSAPSPATIPSSSSAPTNGRPARLKRGLKATLADFHTTLEQASPQHSPTLGSSTELRTAVAGVSGYAGGELARLLLNHPRLAGTQPVFLGRMESSSDTSADGRAGSKQEKLLLTDLQPQLATGNGAAPEVVPFH